MIAYGSITLSFIIIIYVKKEIKTTQNHSFHTKTQSHPRVIVTFTTHKLAALWHHLRHP